MCLVPESQQFYLRGRLRMGEADHVYTLVWALQTNPNQLVFEGESGSRLVWNLKGNGDGDKGGGGDGGEGSEILDDEDDAFLFTGNESRTHYGHTTFPPPRTGKGNL